MHRVSGAEQIIIIYLLQIITMDSSVPQFLPLEWYNENHMPPYTYRVRDQNYKIKKLKNCISYRKEITQNEFEHLYRKLPHPLWKDFFF